MSASHASLTSFAPVIELPDISATRLKNKFSEVIRQASRAPLAVTRHHRREFVILSAEQYEELQQSRRAPLDDLTAEFDQLVAGMNTAKSKRAAEGLFSADARTLGEAAMNASRKTTRA